MKTKAGLPTTTIVIIAIVIMLIVSALIFLAIPVIEDTINPGPCADTCYSKTVGEVTKYRDCEHSSRMIIYYPDGPSGSYPNKHWQYHDGYEDWTSVHYRLLDELRNAVEAAYQGGQISEESWHWFDCTAEAIS